MKRLTMIMLVLGLVAAACSSSDDVGAPAGTTTLAGQSTETSGQVSTTAATTTSTSTTTTIADFGTPAVTGDELPPLEDVDDDAIGLVAPEAIGTDFSGTPVTISNDGRPKAIAFLAHWCPHCQLELPDVQAWLDLTGGVEGVDLYAVATGTNPTRPNYPPSDWFAAEEWVAPVIVDDENYTVLRAFGGTAFPFWVFVDAAGIVQLRIAGRVDIPTLTDLLERLAGP